MTRRHRAIAGFTLVEMMVVLSILSVLALMSLPLAELAVTRQKEKELRHALVEIRDAIDAYKQAVDKGQLVSMTGSGYPASLDVLSDGVPDVKANGAKRYFMRRIPRDPFAPEDVPAAKTWGLRSYDSPPDKPRAGADVFDVYSLSDRRGLNGVPLRQW